MATKETTYVVTSKRTGSAVETVEPFKTKRAAIVAARACVSTCEYVTIHEVVTVKVRGRRWVNVYPYSRRLVAF